MISTIRSYWKATPFVPFALHLSDGRVLNVPHPDFFFMSPNGGFMIVTDDKDQSHVVNPIVLVSVSVAVPQPDAESGTTGRP